MREEVGVSSRTNPKSLLLDGEVAGSECPPSCLGTRLLWYGLVSDK